MSILPELIYRFTATPITNLPGIFVETNKLIVKLILKRKEPRIAKTLKKKNKVEGLILSDFKNYIM